MVAPLYTTESGLLFHAGKILVLTIGLPARGKTHISRALERYLRWMGVKTAVISLGDYRRKVLGGSKNLPPDYFTLGKKSKETQALRKKIADDCEQTISGFFKDGGQVVIYDANNGTKAVRNGVAERFDKEGIHVIMMESICNDKSIIENNIRSVKISSPDYKGWNPDMAVQDYYQRIQDHEKYYETIDDKIWPFIQIFDVGEKIIMNNIHGYLQSRIVFFLMNIHNRFRIIYFARSGQSLIEHSYKADADLSPAGWEYAEQLKEFVLKRRQKLLEKRGLNPSERKLVIWTSTHRRAAHTAWPFLAAARASESLNVRVVEKPQMLEINPGIWDGLSPQQAKKYYPEDWERFIKDPYSYRVPRAESYHDLSVRVDPVLIELEKEQEDLLIIGHASVIRCMLAYLIGLPASEIPAIEVSRGDLLEVIPASYGVQSQAFHFWEAPGRKGPDPTNFYEVYSEDTRRRSFWESIEKMNNQVGVFEDVQPLNKEARGDGDGVDDVTDGETKEDVAVDGSPEIKVEDVTEKQEVAPAA